MHVINILCFVGFEECIHVLLEAKVMPDTHDMAGFTALILAARKGHANIVKLLLQSGSKVDRSVIYTMPTYSDILHLAVRTMGPI